MAFDPRRTQVAQSAHDFAAYFAKSFGAVRVLGAVNRRPDLMAPEGMSTGGGKHARQPIVLRPEQQGGSSLTIGWVDIPQRRAALRTHRCLLQMHQARYGQYPFDLDVGSYNAFFDQAKGLLAACGLYVTEEDQPPPGSIAPSRPNPSVPAPAAESSTFWTTAAIAFIAFVVGAFAGGMAVYAKFVGF